MSNYTLDQLNAMSEADFTAALADIYEHSPWVMQAAYERRPFGKLSTLHNAMAEAVRDATADTRMVLIKAHPDLAGRAARAGALTADSISELSSAGLDALSETEYSHFHELNDAHRVKFGIPFIICVRRHTKDSILSEFERRLALDQTGERDAALTEIFRIAALRLEQKVTAAEGLDLGGQLSTHVLDVHSGAPGADVSVELWELSRQGDDRLILRTVTNKDGRTDKPLIGGRPVPIGTYELRFSVADYYAARGAALSEPPFLDMVPIRFSVSNPEARYHVPLVVSPWSFATYRGS
jgi:2-oxo-4-hydroxy-4-carboxy-5-ureidoimidazoline decarboxylase